MLIWFVTIAILGMGIWHPEVLKAINPVYRLKLLATHGGMRMATFGGAFLARQLTVVQA
jgi:K+ transporter